MRLDDTVLNKDGIANQPIDNSILKNNTEKSQVKEAKYSELKKHIFMKISKASTFQELLNQIRILHLWCTIIMHLTIYTADW